MLGAFVIPQSPSLPPLDSQWRAQFSFPTGPTNLSEDIQTFQRAHWGHAWRRHQASWCSHLVPPRKTLLLSDFLLHSFLCPTGQIVLCLFISPPTLRCASLIIQQKPADRGPFWVSKASTMMALPEIIENEHMNCCLAPKADSLLPEDLLCPCLRSRLKGGGWMFFDAFPGSGCRL